MACLAAWFGGKEEKDPSVGIWSARLRGGKWSTPVEVANGVQAGRDAPAMLESGAMASGRGEGEVVLFYKVGPTAVGLVGRW